MKKTVSEELLSVYNNVDEFCNSPEGQKTIFDTILHAQQIEKELIELRKIKYEDWITPFDI